MRDPVPELGRVNPPFSALAPYLSLSWLKMSSLETSLSLYLRLPLPLLRFSGVCRLAGRMYPPPPPPPPPDVVTRVGVVDAVSSAGFSGELARLASSVPAIRLFW